MGDTSAIAIRPATPSDLPTILVLRQAMLRDLRAADEARIARIDESVREFAVWVEPRLAIGEFAAWLAEDGGQAIASAAAWSYPWFPTVHYGASRIGYLLNVYTAPAYRRRGLARRLVTACLEHLKAQGIRRVTLHPSNDGQRVYESLGFEFTKEMRFTFPDDGQTGS